MNIALVQCPGWGRDCPPYTMALFSAILRENGHKVSCFDINNHLYRASPQEYKKMWDDKDLYSFWTDKAAISEFIQINNHLIEEKIDEILKTDSKIIGFTVHFSSLFVSLELARKIKQADENRIIIFGGPDCVRESRGLEIIKNQFVDAMVVGEGDFTVLELVKMIEEKGKVDFCKGLLIRNNGNIMDCGDREVVTDIDSLPFPDYSDFKEDILAGLYRQPYRLEIFDSRGCFMQCHFCSEWQFWKRFRSMSGERMFAEILHQINNFPQVNYFYFIGSLLNGDIKALSRFCDLLIENNIKIRWLGQAIIRPEMTKELLSKMKRAGCEWLGYGIESGSQKVVDNMNKRFKISDAERVLKDTHEAGIEVQTNFMFGIPTETEEDFSETLEFLKRNRSNINSVLASQSFCVIDKGTYLHTNAKEFKIRDENHHLFWEADNEINSYPERFRRYEEFCNQALSLGVPETSGTLRHKPDKWLLLSDYYNYKKDYHKARLATEFMPLNIGVLEKLINTLKELENSNSISDSEAEIIYESLYKKFDYAFNETQKTIVECLSKKKLWKKLLNYMIIEVQKCRKDTFVFGYPYWLTIDPTNICTLRCPFCPTGQQRNSRPKEAMFFQNFKKIIDELGPYLIHIDFCNWGEPLLNKELFDMIAYAKKFFIDTKVDTNLNYLSEEDAEKMILTGLDRLIVSIDGTSQETYSKYRVGGDFHKVINNLKTLIEKKKELNRKNPFITWQFLVFRHNEHEIEEVKRLGRELGVYAVGITKAFIGDKDWIPINEEYSHYKKEEIKSEYTSEHFKKPPDRFCNWLWEAIVVNSNGSVSPCCSIENEKDDFGNIFQHPFREIWNNQKYSIARRYIKDKQSINTSNSNICIECRHLGLTNPDIPSII